MRKTTSLKTATGRSIGKNMSLSKKTLIAATKKDAGGTGVITK